MSPLRKEWAIITLLMTLSAAAALSGCANFLAPDPAVISEINDSMVKVQTGMRTTEKALMEEARKGCAVYGKRPFYISYVCRDEYCVYREHLLACRK